MNFRLFSPRRRRALLAALALLPLTIWSARAEAQASAGNGATEATPDPASPVMTRDKSGHVTVRTRRLTGAFAFDGALNDAIYRTPPYTGFVQQEPNEGAPATEETEAWIFYDDTYLYVAARLHESHPERRVASDMRRDALNLYNNDHLAVIFDSFGDHRNGFGFATNRLGGLFDFAATNEQPSSNWNGLWESKAQDINGGWTVELRVPFRSIRFREGPGAWGVNIRRMVRWKNEISFLSAVPRSWGRRALNKISDAATMEGVVAPQQGLNLDLKPYALGSQLSNLTASPAIRDRLSGAYGLDAKWALSQQMVADLTYNTDFAQVEDDEAQVNLTRFSLFFPEKREFFLEGQDAFAFAGQGGGGGGGGGGGMFPGMNPNDNIAPVLFYSRRIGISDAGMVPILGGARALGRSGNWQVGALSMQTEALSGTTVPSTNFSVLRINRDILQRSRIGMIATSRSPGAAANAGNLAVGADAQINLSDDLQFTSYVARTETKGKTGDQNSYRARMDWNADRYGLNLEQMAVGQDFNPEVGFMRRAAFHRSYAQARFSPRPKTIPAVRKFTVQASGDYITNAAGALQTQEFRTLAMSELSNGDFLYVEGTRNVEQLSAAFGVARGVTVPVGRYDFAQGRLSYQMGPQRPISGTVTVARGSFYGGTLTEATWRGRVEFSGRLYAEPTISWNQVTGPYGNGDANLYGSRITYTVTPRLFVAALTQYQSRTRTVSTNLRFRWEYQPGSELFLVYSDGRTTDTPTARFPVLENRALVIKLTKLFRW